MLTRLKVSGFKNLVDVDVRFGPFTCIAGVNGVGKSNLLDAIRFLSLLADKSLNEAALSIRGEGGTNADIRGLFQRVGDEHVREMSFEVEMITPRIAYDIWNQEINDHYTALRYKLILRYDADKDSLPIDRLKITQEELAILHIDNISEMLIFPYKSIWYESAIKSANFSDDTTVIGTDFEKDEIFFGDKKYIYFSEFTHKLRKTMVNNFRGEQEPSEIAAAYREMSSWRYILFNPDVIRQPSPIYKLYDALEDDKHVLGDDGSHIAAELYALSHRPNDNGRTYAEVSRRLAELLNVRKVWVERDDKREELYLMLEDLDGVVHPARALSDGTLRYLALAALMQRDVPELICLDEIENGLHPKRIEAAIRMLLDSVVDTEFAIDAHNPLRQVIVTTHSPVVVQQVPPDSLLIARSDVQVNENKQRYSTVKFASLEGTWRDGEKISMADMLAYLNPVPFSDDMRDENDPPRLVDREDVRQLMQPRDYDAL